MTSSVESLEALTARLSLDDTTVTSAQSAAVARAPVASSTSLTVVNAALPGRTVTIAEDTSITSVEKIARQPIASAFSAAVAFKEKFGPIGEVLAGALPCFSLDVVAIIAGYRATEEALRLKEDVLLKEKVGQEVYVLTVSEDAEARIRDFADDVHSLNLYIIRPKSLGAASFAKIFDVKFIEKYAPYFKTLRSLKIECSLLAAIHLHKFPALCHLELTRKCPTFSIGSIFKKFEEKMFHLKSLTLPAVTPTLIEHLPGFQELTELSLGSVSTGDIDSLLQSLQYLAKLKSLRISAGTDLGFYFSSDKSKFMKLPLEKLCFEGWLTAECADLEFPKKLRTLIFKDCRGITEEDCNALQRKLNIQVLYLESPPASQADTQIT